ncbi:MAG: helix-turn-helix domain-containing protein [Balneolaceae bacterium]|nr:helix-turn-helix domain-containing protein [Balneolaceae bacterium]
MASLGNDLASIRIERDLSIEDLKQKTKIPVSILKSIEDDSIFERINENNTYTRSYVRSYAKAVGIENERIVRALDLVQKGQYKGSLLNDTDIERRSSFQYDTPGSRQDTGGGDMVHDHSPEFSQAEKESESQKESSSSSSATPPSINTVDWANMGRKFTPIESKSRMWVGVIILAVFVVGAAAVAWYQFYEGEPTGDEQVTQNETTQPAVNPDSLQLNLTEPASSSNSELTRGSDGAETLPDTLSLLIYAAYDKLEPVRVNTDLLDSLNPYWIEKGEAFRFEFVNNIEFRGQYSRMAILFNGHVVENFRQQFLNSQTGMVEINRSFFEEEPSRWLQTAPDSLSVPQPITIKERPIFN